MTPKKTKWLDLASMGLSGLCVVHCLLLPFLVAALPFLGIFSQNEWVHQVLVSVAAPLSALALWRSGGWRRLRVWGPMATGLALLSAAAFIPDLEPVEAPMSVIGALMVAAAHVVNYGGLRALHRHTADCACDA
ncbi:MerC domain-containing protein [Asticcacaulis solisilvae]|uniref:MerC domain-containing protein n=1 Tax=Asticcacaulis solisilvae TaxID=1217274 RepID=UPI003FD7C5C3